MAMDEIEKESADMDAAARASLQQQQTMVVPDPVSDAGSTRRSSAVLSNANNLFDENDPKYLIFTVIHCRKIAIINALFGVVACCVIFGVAVCYFRWYFYEIEVDAIALIGFSIFLISGVVVHLCLLNAVNKSKTPFVMPFIIFHVFLMLIETIMALTAVEELVSDQEESVDESDLLARQILLCTPVCLCLQSLMIYGGLMFRRYLKQKNASITTYGGIVPVLTMRNAVTPTLADILNDKC